MDAAFISYVVALMSCLKESHFFYPFPAKSNLGKITDAVMQNRSDKIKHTVNTKTGVHIIILFHVLQFYYHCIPGVLSLTELKMRRVGAGD